MRNQVLRLTLFVVVWIPSSSQAATSSSPTDSLHFCQIVDFEQWRRDHPPPSGKRLADLNVGEPRSVRMIYFLPSDRPFRQEVVDSMKVGIKEAQAFYAEQMEAHGYGPMTFRFETDGQGEPLVHRVDGRHPDRGYTGSSGTVSRAVYEELEQSFDLLANVYLTFLDHSTNSIGGALGVGGREGKTGGYGLVPGRPTLTTVVHELGHAFGLQHDFRDDAYIMSYGPEADRRRLSACAVEFLVSNPYLNPTSPLEEGHGPAIELLSPRDFLPESESHSIQFRVTDAQDLQQAILFGGRGNETTVLRCRELSGARDATVEFEYEGVIPSYISASSVANLSEREDHPLIFQVVNSEGDVSRTHFQLVERSPLLITALEGHSDGVYSMSFSPDGARLAFLTEGRRLVLWDPSTREIFTLEEDGWWIGSVSFSPDGALLASGSAGRVTLWNVKTREPAAVLEGHTTEVRREGGSNTDLHWINTVSFSPDGALLATGASDSTVILWDVATHEPITTLEKHAGWVDAVSFSPDGTLLASLASGNIYLWDVPTRQRVAILKGANRFRALSFSPDGDLLASGDWHKATLWDVATREPISDLWGHWGEVEAVSFSVPDGALLATGGTDGQVRLWDVLTGESIVTFRHADPITSLSLATRGAMLAAGGSDGTVLVWDTSQWTAPRPFDVRIVSGDGQVGPPGAVLPRPWVVEVRDQYGDLLPGAAVTFRITFGDGKLSSRFTMEQATTNSGGRAEITFTLGPHPGKNTVGVFVDGREMVAFRAEGVGAEVIDMGGDYRTWHLPEGVRTRLGKGSLGKDRQVEDGMMALSSDGRCLAVATAIGVWLYEVAEARPLALLPSSHPVLSVALSREGFLAAGLDNGRVVLWEVATGEQVGHLQHDEYDVSSVVFSRDGTALASGSVRQTKLWDVHARRQVGTWEVSQDSAGSDNYSWAISLSPDGRTVASGLEDGTVRLWDVATQSEVAILEGHTDKVNSVSFSPDGALLASGSNDETAVLWDVATQTEIATLGDRAEPGPKGGWTIGRFFWVLAVAFSPDGTQLASGDLDGTVSVWDVATRTRTGTFQGPTDRIRDEIVSVSFTPDGASLVSGAADGRLLMWDVRTGGYTALPGHTSFTSMAFSPEGRILACGLLDGTIVLWDTATRTPVAGLEGHEGFRVKSVSFSPDGALLASLGGSWSTVNLWDMATHTRLATLDEREILSSAAFSADGALLASGSDDHTVIVWDVRTRERIATLEGHQGPVESVSFSPDGLLASGSWDNTVMLWDVRNRERIATLEGHQNQVFAVCFSPDGALLASGSGEGTVLLWDVRTQERIATLEGHQWTVTMVSFSPDGALLASGSRDNTVILWDVTTQDRIATLEGHRGQVFTVSFSPDGATLGSGASDGTILLWDLQRMKPRAHSLTKMSGLDQKGTAGAGLGQPLVVSVRDQNGEPFGGPLVTFTVTSGGGTLSATAVTTDAQGRAETTLTLGSQPGPNRVEATVAGLEPVTFTAVGLATPDFDGDGEVEFSDFFLFAEAFGGSDPRFDLDGSGSVDFADFFLFAEHFGQPARAKLMALASERIGLPEGPQLWPNAPNPFNSGTVLSWWS